MIKAPAGAVVASMPDEHKKVEQGGKQYVVFNNVTYEPFFLDGELRYKVVKA